MTAISPDTRLSPPLDATDGGREVAIAAVHVHELGKIGRHKTEHVERGIKRQQLLFGTRCHLICRNDHPG
jgi:hypothetical protein